MSRSVTVTSFTNFHSSQIKEGSQESAEATVRSGGLTVRGSFIDGNSGFPLAQSTQTNPVVHPVSLTKTMGVVSPRTKDREVKLTSAEV